MKKYKLLKELPWMKAGTIFTIDSKTGWMKSDEGYLAADCYQATKHYFFSEGFENNNWMVEIPASAEKERV